MTARRDTPCFEKTYKLSVESFLNGRQDALVHSARALDVFIIYYNNGKNQRGRWWGGGGAKGQEFNQHLSRVT